MGASVGCGYGSETEIVVSTLKEVSNRVEQFLHKLICK
jgi:hypothetical protein